MSYGTHLNVYDRPVKCTTNLLSSYDMSQRTHSVRSAAKEKTEKLELASSRRILVLQVLIQSPGVACIQGTSRRYTEIPPSLEAETQERRRTPLLTCSSFNIHKNSGSTRVGQSYCNRYSNHCELTIDTNHNEKIEGYGCG
eukprot:gnl/MRDRNA2_/MRDRNA2_84196_c0_seq3.p1 gnl/MRDRNA2_/MRDRNA2_84196_c0~~gnl/MRDRNA2_/MRDRNA2_84196_c0_seq3.p1  ORF type:complete len:141 (+),score=0.08 gnl/MRDRNA2_/MRDRNA2_84196_c0_seq3:249-671(+)